jgi:RNA polymerase sigma factor (TIGR02999 family)
MRPDIPLDNTGLLQKWSHGERAALDDLTPLVYQELRRLARRHLAGQPQEQTLNTTALVHEAWLRLVTIQNLQLQDQSQFFALCAQLIRRILIDHARARSRARRGGGAPRVSLDEVLLVPEERIPAMIALDDALQELSVLDPRKARVVELRFFGGLSVAEAAAVLRISPQSVERDWRLARLWLIRELKRGPGNGR